MIESFTEQDTQARSKHWNNLVSLLRLKLATLEPSGNVSNAQVEELFDTEIYVTSASGILSMWLDPESGQGSLNVITTEQTAEPWSMSISGFIELRNQVMSIESAVTTLALKLSKNGTNL